MGDEPTSPCQASVYRNVPRLLGLPGPRQLADLAAPLLEAMLADALRQPVLYTDATGVLVQAPERCRLGHFWVLVAPERHVLFRYSRRHDGAAVDALLPGAKQTGTPMAVLENKSGTYVKADPASEKAALASVALPPDLRAWIPDPSAPAAYPIVTYTWILAYKKYADPKIKDALKDVIRYCLTDGQKFSDALGYIPLPANVVTEVTRALDQIS